MATELTRPEIDFLILADRAEAVNGKLYMLGGGWDRITVTDFEKPVSFSLAVGVLIPWTETNEDHPLTIYLEDQDGATMPGTELNVRVNMGRPPEAIPGQSFRAMIAVNGMWKFPKPETYTVVAALSSGEPKRTVFHVRGPQAGRS